MGRRERLAIDVQRLRAARGAEQHPQHRGAGIERHGVGAG